jgi:uncharacterized protein (DUF885 family)
VGRGVNEQLARLAEGYWDLELQRGPTGGLFVGDYRYADRMEDLSREAEDDSIERLEAVAAEAVAIDPDGLTSDEKVTRGVMIEEAESTAAELSSRLEEFAVDASGGMHVALLQLVSQIAPPTADVAEAIVTKWSRLGATFDQAIERLREGMANGRTPPRVAVEKSITQIDSYLDSDVNADPFTMLSAPPAFTEEQGEQWREQLRGQVQNVIRPAYAKYRDLLRDRVLDAARPEEHSGVRWLPDGEDIYTRAIRRHTSLELSAEDIHQIGLDEINRLEAEFRDLGGRVLGTTDLPEIYGSLRDDPELKFGTSDEVRDSARTAMERARDAIPEWFGRLPVTECVMADVPQPGAEDAPLAFYLPPAGDGSRPGTFFINTTEPATRTRYESEALAFHESIPGHHLQLAISQELEGIPEFRKHALVTVYAEGWGLYTERLADEMGLYTSDLSRMGILSFDSWRAGRLVVDTGIHALGWSRQEAIDYLAANSPQAINNIENEVDRYIGWPGQALAYKIGQREIFRLRAEAQRLLGDRFDIKGFHDAVLGSGLVPLPILGEIVEDWVNGSA